MKINLLYLLILGYLLTGCLPQSNYTPQKFDVPEEFRIVDVEVDGANSISPLQNGISIHTIDSSKLNWHYYFRDKQLVSLIDSGLRHNFDVRIAIKNLEIYNLQYKQAGMELLPTVGATVANPSYQFRSEDFYSSALDKWYGSSDSPKNMFLYRSQNVTGLNFSWEVDIWGKIRSEREEKKFEYLSTLEAKNAVQTQIIAEIATSYYHLLSLYAQLEVAESNYKLSQRTLGIVELQYESGNTTALAKQQTKSQMLIAKALIPKIKQKIGEEENKIQFLTGGLPAELQLSSDNFESIFSKIERKYSIPLSMVSYRADVKLAENNLWAANARVGVAQASRYPRLVIDLNFGVNALLPTNWFNIPGALFGDIFGNLTQPIFNKKRLKTKFEQAKIDREIKEIELQKTVYQSINEISNLLTTMNSLDEQILIAEEQVANSELTISQSNLLFNSGYASYLEVINAQSVALDSQMELSKLKENRILLKVALYI